MIYFFISSIVATRGKKKNLVSGQRATLAGVEQTIPYADPSIEGENLCENLNH